MYIRTPRALAVGVSAKNMACIDTKSFPNLIDDLIEAGIATTVDMQITPKYDNTYPVCKLDLSKIPNIKPF